MKLTYTRAMITAALQGQLQNVPTTINPVFGMEVPVQCPGVPSEILTHRNTWTDKDAYDEKANFLYDLFIKNFEKYTSGVSKKILEAAPRIYASV